MTPDDRKRAHEVGLAAVKRGESYREAFFASLGQLLPRIGAPPPMSAHGGVNPAGVADDPLFGHDAVMRRGKRQYREPDPEGPFNWRTLA
jgi:hypothetical protein